MTGFDGIWQIITQKYRNQESIWHTPHSTYRQWVSNKWWYHVLFWFRCNAQRRIIFSWPLSGILALTQSSTLKSTGRYGRRWYTGSSASDKIDNEGGPVWVNLCFIIVWGLSVNEWRPTDDWLTHVLSFELIFFLTIMPVQYRRHSLNQFIWPLKSRGSLELMD